MSSEGHLPGFDGAIGWLNSPPLAAADVAGKVVLVDFWTYTCINWLRTLSYVRAWDEKYHDRGLVTVGVHTPEFPFEQDVDNVREAVRDMRIEYPVAIDSDYGLWRAFSNHYWPAVYIADAHGRIRHHQFGEGRYEECERVIQRLLREARVEGVGDALVSVAADGFEAQADWTNLASPETYLGYEQTQNFASSAGVAFDEPRTYAAPELFEPQPLGSLRGLDDRERGQPAEPSRGTDRVPLPRPRRPSRPATAGARDVRAVPSAHRRRASRRRARRRRGRRRPRHGGPTAALSASSPAGIDHRPHVRDHLPRSQHRGLRLHLRLAVASPREVVGPNEVLDTKPKPHNTAGTNDGPDNPTFERGCAEIASTVPKTA